jgi:Group XII secretory phospholipase A2 precursor (PLA2G12)
MKFMKSIGLIIISVFSPFLLVTLPVKATHKEVNGCGDNSGLGRFVPNQPTGVDFRPVCDNHDRCYGTLGQSRKDCDDNFRSGLRAKCEKELLRKTGGVLGTIVTGGQALTGCYGVAEIYYQAVRDRGGPAYSTAQNHAKEEQQSIVGVVSPPIFDAGFYLSSYKDLRNAFGTNRESAKNHWLTYGIKEGRQAHPDFSPKCYLNRYPDLQRAVGASNYSAAIAHYLKYGRNENRNGKC